MYFLLFLPTFTHLFTALRQQKSLICLPTKVRFLNDVFPRQMITATPNDVRFANDVCLTVHWGKHRITRGTKWSNIIFAKQMHHIAEGDASFLKCKADALI